MDLSIIIVNWNTKDLLINCLKSVFDYIKNQEFEVWVVDNGSSDDSVEAVQQQYPIVNIIENNKNLGFAAANNQALRKMAGKYALLLNTDTMVTKGAIEQLYSFIETHPKVGMICGQLLNEDGTRQNSFANFPSIPAMLSNETVLRIFLPKKFPSKRRNYLKPIPVDSCIGACMLVRKSAIDQVGFLDDDYFFYFEETDWAYRMRQHNWEVFFIPTAKIFHLQGKTAKYSAATRIMFYRSRNTYYKKWHPNKLRIMQIIVIIRLLIDICLNSMKFMLTLGCNINARQRIAVYNRIVAWHLRGCPE